MNRSRVQRVAKYVLELWEGMVHGACPSAQELEGLRTPDHPQGPHHFTKYSRRNAVGTQNTHVTSKSS